MFAGKYVIKAFAKWKTYMLAPSQDWSVTIVDQCEPPTFTLPAKLAKNPRWAVGTGDATLKIPKVKVVPARCRTSYAVTIPKELKEVAKVNDKGDIVLAGIPKRPIKAGTYKFKIQAKTQLGEKIDKAVFDFAIDLVEKKKPAAEAVITTIAATTGVAAIANAAASAA